MPDVQSSTLRIYCLCGQKMRVSEKMYGLPGKCVACRQKIRIPKKSDVPDGVTDIHLKDHPELVRGPAKVSAEERAARKALAKAGSAPESGEESTPNTELDLPDSPPPNTPPPPSKKSSSRGSLPLDVLPPLQVLCSLDYKFSRELDALQINSHDDEVLLAELEGHQTRVRKLRSHLDDQLHQRLMETAIELTNTQEKLAQARLGARVGETTWNEFQKNVHRLRMRRDRLERRQQNLRGWLATRDPYLAGGLLDLSVNNIPEDGFAVTLPPESSDDSAQLAELVEGLRAALDNRAQVRQRAAEVQKMAEGNGAKEVTELRKECEQQRLVARARVAFAHDRLQQLKKDYASDNETANAMLAASRDKLRMDAIARPEYDEFERDILRSKKDLARAQAVIERALGANAAEDVPSPQGTYLHRLGVGGARNAPDMLLAYAAAAALVISIVLPSLGTLSLGGAALEYGTDGGAAAWLFLGPLALAATVAGITFAGGATLRSWLYLGAWLVGFVSAALIVHEAGYGLDPLAARFRSAAQWYLQPGIVLLFMGLFCVLAASLSAVWRQKDSRVWPVIVAAVGMTAAGLISTDVGGALRPEPSLMVENADVSGAGVVRVGNQGGRSVRLLNRQTDARGAYQFYIDQRVGASSFRDADGEGPLWDTPPADGVLYVVAPGAQQDVPFVLPPGEYRAVLESAALEEPIVSGFTVAAPQSEAAPAPDEPVSGSAPSATAPAVVAPAPDAPVFADPDAAENAAPDDAAMDEAPAPDEEMPAEEEFAPLDPNGQPTVELIGIVTSENQEPRFSLRVFYPDGTEDRLVLAMGGVVWGDWTITEFNPDQNTVTLEGENGLLILRRGVETEFSRR
jgi:hypothetical protein